MRNTIKAVDSDSPLKGIAKPGDSLLSINNNPIHDVLDYKFFAYDAELEVLLRGKDGKEHRHRIRKQEGGDLGLDFETYLMDAPRACANSCVFCFIDQLPEGMRQSMYFKDDDARLSFLMGNYITLTNLSPREIDRIIALHISPVNVSVHTTDPELRCTMLRNPNAGKALETMRRLAENGIKLNCQIVCCPGLNDGKELQRTMEDLEALYPGVNSVSVVPVGLTRHRDGLYPLRGFTRSEAADTVDLVEKFSEECLKRHGTRLVFCSDELYIRAGRELPPDEFFEEHTQLDNGVGMLRLLETEFRSALKLADPPDGVPFTIATGEAAALYLQKLVELARESFPELNGQVTAVKNDFFGRDVTVAGLVTGTDLVSQLKGRDLGGRLFIAQNMLRRDEVDFLDGMTLAEASEALGVPIYPVEQDGFALLDAISGILPEIPQPVESEPVQYCKYNT